MKPFPNALCRVQFYVQIGDIWPEETPSNPAGPSQCLPRGDLAGPHTPYFRACLLVGGGYTGTYFSPWVPECISYPRGKVSGASLTSGGSLAPISPLGCLWGDMYSRWGPWEHVSPYPGSLGSLFSSQDSWEDLRHVSLGPHPFPGKGVISEACPGRDVLALPAPLLWGSLTCSTLGKDWTALSCLFS